MFTVITENDESEWNDVTGVSYHFPQKYLTLLAPGTSVVYYKGALKKAVFRSQRLSDEPHYFGFASIGRVYPDAKSTKGDHFAEINSFRRFSAAVLAKQDGEFVEVIPESRISNYWRDGVRLVTQEIFQRIDSLATITDGDDPDGALANDHLQGLPESLTSGVEGIPHQRITSYYERSRKLRDAAIRLHGTTCLACGFNFSKRYGQHGAGYIQVHHLKPLSDESGERSVVVETDLVVLCANCHVMVHRIREKTLTIEQLRTIIAGDVA